MSRAQTGQRHPSMSLIMRSLFAVNYSGGACIRKYRVPMAPVQHSIHVAAFVESCLGIRRSCKGHVRNVASGKLTLRVARLHAQAPEARFCLTSCNKSRSIRSFKPTFQRFSEYALGARFRNRTRKKLVIVASECLTKALRIDGCAESDLYLNSGKKVEAELLHFSA